MLNARVNLELERVVAELNRDGRDRPCQKVRLRFFKRHRMLFFDGFETWSANSPLVSRSPSGPEEMEEFERKYVYGGTSPLFDTGRWMPPGPTVEVDGVRFGTDKLTHLLGTAWYYHRWYRKARARGATAAEAEDRAVRRGLRHEITILGRLVSGVPLPGRSGGELRGHVVSTSTSAPATTRTSSTRRGRGRLRRPFDLRDHVTPEWDESYQPNIYLRRKWEKVRSRMLRYCSMLEHPQVSAMRQAYAKRDRITETEKLMDEMVAAGRLPDPSGFSIESVCREVPG